MRILLLLCLLMSHTPTNIQTPYVAADFWTQWDSVNPRMALMVKVTSTAAFGSEVIAFTSNTRDMTMPGHVGVTFKASPAITPTIIEAGLDEALQLEMNGVYSSDSFVRTDVIAGKWNFAEVEVFSACWDNVNLGEFLHFKGKLGEIRDYQTYFKVEGRGLMALLSQDVSKVTQRLCRHTFRDALCGHSASTVTIDAVVYNVVETGLVPDGSFAAEDTFINILTSGFAGNVPPVNYYVNGKMTAVGGDNDGVSREIAYNSAASGGLMAIQLKRPFPFNISDGDPSWSLTLTAGCSKTLEDCMKFSNIVNRAAEDYIPGIETVNRLPPAN